MIRYLCNANGTTGRIKMVKITVSQPGPIDDVVYVIARMGETWKVSRHLSDAAVFTDDECKRFVPEIQRAFPHLDVGFDPVD